MSFKRFDSEDIVLSSELITFPTWYTQEAGDIDLLYGKDAVESPEQGRSVLYYTDFYSAYSGSEGMPSSSNPAHDGLGILSTHSVDPGYSPEHSKPLFSMAFATRPRTDDGFVSASADSAITASEVVFGQYRSLVLGDEYSEFTFGSTVIGSQTEDPDESGAVRAADSFIAMSVDRSRFREKLDPDTCRIFFNTGSGESEVSYSLELRPDTSANRRYLDAGRVFDLARYEEIDGTGSLVYPTASDGSSLGSYGYFLPDIGVILFNTSNTGSLFGFEPGSEGTWYVDSHDAVLEFKKKLYAIRLRSQETVTSNYVFVRARNGEFNYSTNPSNIVGSAGNIRHDVMINQPQSFITTVGLYNDSNELLAVAKLSRPLVKDFTKEALIRIKLDY